jgi:hypothetical protein
MLCIFLPPLVWLKGNAASHECGAQTGKGAKLEVIDDMADPEKGVQAGNTSQMSEREDMPARTVSQELSSANSEEPHAAEAPRQGFSSETVVMLLAARTRTGAPGVN